MPKKRFRFPHIRIVFGALPQDWGYMYPNEWTIYLDKRMEDKLLLEIAAHETAHVVLPVLDETAVELLGKHVGDVLFRLGFRRLEKDEL